MKTIADFKRKISAAQIENTTISTKLYWSDKNGQFQQVNDLQNRTVMVVQSNSFALSLEKNGKIESSWCEWPKKHEFEPLGENEAEIFFEGGKLHYQFNQ